MDKYLVSNKDGSVIKVEIWSSFKSALYGPLRLIRDKNYMPFLVYLALSLISIFIAWPLIGMAYNQSRYQALLKQGYLPFNNEDLNGSHPKMNKDRIKFSRIGSLDDTF